MKFPLKNHNLIESLFVLSPFFLAFSYFPVINFGRGEGMNFEISVALIFCMVFAIAGFLSKFSQIIQLFRSKNQAVFLTGAWILWQIVSIFWAKNPTRAILTSGVWGVLWLDFLVILTFLEKKILFEKFKKSLILAGLWLSFLAILQVIYGAFTDWGVCAGCRAEGFGFVRASVFFIEPQFLGSFLLVPILLAWNDFLLKKPQKRNFAFSVILLLAMWLTLSRGAIFSLVLAMILSVFLVKNQGEKKYFRSKNLAILAVILPVGFGVGLVLHGAMTALNPRVTDGFYDSVTKSVNQMSLGKISLPKNTDKSPEIPKKEIHNSVENNVEKPVENSVENSPKKAIFDGYVERSTDERNNLSNLAIKTWLKNSKNMILGVGAGSGGRAIFSETGGIGWDLEIVQNEPLNILLENGIIGIMIWTSILIGIFRKTALRKGYWAILVAILLQWNFFSGLPNALHIYIFLAAIFVGILSKTSSKKFENSLKI